MSWDPDELDRAENPNPSKHQVEALWILFVSAILIVIAVAISINMYETKNSNRNTIHVNCIDGYVFYRTFNSDPWVQMFDSSGNARVCTG